MNAETVLHQKILAPNSQTLFCVLQTWRIGKELTSLPRFARRWLSMKQEEPEGGKFDV